MSSLSHDTLCADLSQILVRRLSRCPRRPGAASLLIRRASALLCRSWLKIYHRLRIDGRENLPTSGSYILVANHASHLDTLCLLAALPMAKLHKTYPAAAADFFFTSVPRVAFAALCINAMPFHRREQRAVRQSIATCRQILAQTDNVLIVFPEGTRTTDGKAGVFRRGVGDLVAGRRVPVVPCHLEGSFDALPRGSWFPKPVKLRLRIGRPMIFADRDATKSDAIQICDELRQAVLALGAPFHPERSEGSPMPSDASGPEILRGVPLRMTLQHLAELQNHQKERVS